ncbi:hypothetical protein K469DRAFT_664515 [Zopfia rhizophila CBS 207.26]|uniref:ubiquitinyl hydrolase 1 n=1 Tax=Zopfia rhizophila CBS 207.26 TaxID=1314779 RepID=A0A6A6E6D1_9PEZI|nr:hypothetical protein K469DRAFT_664515 [Zopfia rhizophila CBS 207.26]
MDTAASRTALLEHLYCHIVLPRKLPGREDNQLDKLQVVLGDRFIAALKHLIQLASLDVQSQLDTVRCSVQTSTTLNIGVRLNRLSLLKELSCVEGSNALILYISEQNAGVIIYSKRDHYGENRAIFEAFEASPDSSSVIASKNALEWDFPGCAVSVSYRQYSDPSFQEQLATFLEKASIEPVKRFAAKTYKAGSSITEIRNTNSPMLITEMLMTLLEANGRPHFPPLLRKRVRDNVSWNDAHKPWRRMPFWLILRVAVQRQLYSLLGEETGRAHYKFLMVLFLARFLDNVLHIIPHEASEALKTKLGRRLAKLESERERATTKSRAVYDHLFQHMRPLFSKIMAGASGYLLREWEKFKKNICRPITLLPKRADESDLVLRLPTSGHFLDFILSKPLAGLHPPVYLPIQFVEHYEASIAANKPFVAFCNRYVSLMTFETCEEVADESRRYDVQNEQRCTELALRIQSYIRDVGDAYDDYLEVKSIMLLTLLELWVAMDDRAIKLFSPLRDYHPGFDHHVLDHLHLLSSAELQRVQRVQFYLSTRCQEAASPRTIFEDPSESCFPVRYFDFSADSARLHLLRESIEQDAAARRIAKEHEWQSLSQKYEKLIQEISETPCLYMTNEVTLMRDHDDRRCRKCFLQRVAKRTKIQVYEHPLPSDEVTLKAVLFEVGCPTSFASYRDATWLILSTFGRMKQESVATPRLLLRDYSGLSGHFNATKPSLSLASTTKSHLMSHYSDIRLPIDLDSVCRPCGLRLKYFDSRTCFWTGSPKQKPSFTESFSLRLPSNSPYSTGLISRQLLAKVRSPRVVTSDEGDDWPSSYEVIANQTSSPSELNIHEFTAGQSLLNGTHCRWLTLLRELGSSNINFSSESTVSLVSRLVMQLGPMSNDDFLRDIHVVFREPSFCARLFQQIDQRLEGIRRNWREPLQMELLITILLRAAWSISAPPIRSQALDLIVKARAITWDWIVQLRTEIQSSEADSTERTADYPTWAALLCKRTFHLHQDPLSAIDPAALKYFIGASIALQDNLSGKINTLPFHFRNAILRDLRLAFQIRPLIEHSIAASQQALLTAITAFWPVPEGFLNQSADVVFLNDPHCDWIQITMGSKFQSTKHFVHYNFVFGHLIINGKPLGKLPAEYRESSVLQNLFRTRNLMAYPSTLPGMSFVLALDLPYNYQVHIGYRDGKLVVRACQGRWTFELIPREIFSMGAQFDLPIPLIENCFHWLDLHSGILEIRQDEMWKSKEGNWRINLHTRRATRRTSTLVDPNSPLCRAVAPKFMYFEYPTQLVVFQPFTRNLTVELRRLELSFFVNRKGLLESPQLRGVISPDQDAGTWYGLDSKLLISSTKNDCQRRILVPLGIHKYRSEGPHIRIRISNPGAYATFEINKILGRLECPAEPKLLYLRAKLHAMTSYFIPDQLTGNTGADEALRQLQSGCYQPWSPLMPDNLEILVDIAKLTPKREYYPPDLKCMENVSWDPNLTASIQDDRYRYLAETIWSKSARLSLFAVDAQPQCSHTYPSGNPHLESRAILKLCNYTPPAWLSGEESTLDHHYLGRHCRQQSSERSNVFSCTALLRDWPSEIYTTHDLPGLLQQFRTIGGHVRHFDKSLLTDHLEVDLGIEWGALVSTCCQATKSDKYWLMFLLGLIAFRPDANMELLRVLIAFAVLSEPKLLKPPSWPSYVQFRPNQVPKIEYLVQLIRSARVSQSSDERDALNPYLRAKQRARIAAEKRAAEDMAENEYNKLAKFFLDQWPCESLSLDNFPAATYINIESAMAIIQPEWMRLVRNFEFFRYLERVQSVLKKYMTECHGVAHSAEPTTSRESEVYAMRARGREIPNLQELLQKRVGFLKTSSNPIFVTRLNGLISPSPEPPGSINETRRGMTKIVPNPQITKLNGIVATLKKSRSLIHNQYGLELEQSINALGSLSSPNSEAMSFDPMALSAQIHEARRMCQQKLEHLQKTLTKNDRRAYWLEQCRLWPKMDLISLLEQLRSSSQSAFGSGTKEALVDLGIAVTALQRFLRIEDALSKGNAQQYIDEIRNIGHRNWDPSRNTDWLLLEIDSNFLIRPEQVDVANATISPGSGGNSVLQLLMGKGMYFSKIPSKSKTSCILPMVAVVLADKCKLLRVIVPRPLLLQSAQVIQSRLGGLLNREVLHIPFSRRTPTDCGLTQTFYRLHRELQKKSGIVLALPEHLLSFKLSGIQRLCDGRIEEAKPMIKVQSWFDKVARDVLDECDISLAVRTQLIYTSGTQMAVDGHPQRWQTIQDVLRLVEAHLWSVHYKFPRSVEIVQRFPGGYPFIYFLRQDAEDHLLARLVDDIYKGRMPSLQCAEYPDQHRQSIKEFISLPKVTSGTLDQINEMFKDKLHLKKVVYLLRGLLVHRILLLALRKRWNVQYGLNPARDPIAVPFHAKGVPSASAEWGHPDVAILLTALSFYYGGLDISQFRQALEQLLKSDEPSVEYEKWTSGNVPGSLRDWNSINVDDKSQLIELHRHCRFNVALLEYYLNNLVFPQHAKQFKTKLCASGWDLVLYNPEDCTDRGLETRTTGFSGTNDGRNMLPLTVKQEDLPSLAHTNAEVLSYLLEPRNRQYFIAADQGGRRLSEDGLLATLKTMRIRILIDSGAQILEHDNYQLAKAWLSIDHEAAAAVYFDEDNRVWVLYRKGSRVPLLASPFAENMTGCVVYLDESHCRGTDLKLPVDARAALTLGPHLSKDALVQAAMRLRLLGQSQSVAFFAPLEVHQSIIDLRRKSYHDHVDSYDVICWLVESTCNAIEQLQPLYFSQGMDFCQHMQARLDNPDFLRDEAHRKEYLDNLRSKELQTLKKLYEPKQSKPSPEVTLFASSLSGYVRELNKRKKGFQDRGHAVHATALEEVEQEREVAFEVESVREIQKPAYYAPLQFPGLHPDIKKFVETGKLIAGSAGYEHAFYALKKTALGIKHRLRSENATSKLYVSSQFSRTVNIVQPNDNFLRPVQWILWSICSETALVIIPEEANLLIPILRQELADTHLILYSAPVTRRMLHFNSLDFYAIPPLPAGFKAPTWLTIELGILSGRLYFEWEEYGEMLRFLGINSDDRMSGLDDEIQSAKLERFTKNPLTFLHEWLAVRRKGQDFEHTPMGFVTTGKILSAEHPFFRTSSSIERERSSKKLFAKSQKLRNEVAEESDDDGYESEEFYNLNEDHIDADEDEDIDGYVGVDVRENAFFNGAEYIEELKGEKG